MFRHCYRSPDRLAWLGGEPRSDCLGARGGTPEISELPIRGMAAITSGSVPAWNVPAALKSFWDAGKRHECEMQPHKSRNEGCLPVSQLPRRPSPQTQPEDQAQVECAHVNQLPLQDVFSPSQMGSSHAASFVAVGEGSFDQLPSLLQ